MIETRAKVMFMYTPIGIVNYKTLPNWFCDITEMYWSVTNYYRYRSSVLKKGQVHTCMKVMMCIDVVEDVSWHCSRWRTWLLPTSMGKGYPVYLSQVYDIIRDLVKSLYDLIKYQSKFK